jgi:hypothetical protein
MGKITCQVWNLSFLAGEINGIDISQSFLILARDRLWPYPMKIAQQKHRKKVSIGVQQKVILLITFVDATRVKSMPFGR